MGYSYCVFEWSKHVTIFSDCIWQDGACHPYLGTDCVNFY